MNGCADSWPLSLALSISCKHGAGHACFESASYMMSALIWASAVHLLQAPVLFLQLPHARETIEASMASYFDRHLYVAELIPCSRQSSGTGAPASACFKIAMIRHGESGFLQGNLFGQGYGLAPTMQRSA